MAASTAAAGGNWPHSSSWPFQPYQQSQSLGARWGAFLVRARGQSASVRSLDNGLFFYFEINWIKIVQSRTSNLNEIIFYLITLFWTCAVSFCWKLIFMIISGSIQTMTICHTLVNFNILQKLTRCIIYRASASSQRSLFTWMLSWNENLKI